MHQKSESEVVIQEGSCRSWQTRLLVVMIDTGAQIICPRPRAKPHKCLTSALMTTTLAGKEVLFLVLILLASLKILLYILAALAGLFVLSLVLPLEYRIHTAVDNVVRVNATVFLLLRIFAVEFACEHKEMQRSLLVVGIRVRRTNPVGRSGNVSKKRRRSKKRLSRKVSVLDFLQQEFLHDAATFLKKLIRMIRPRRIEIHGVYGFNDPVLTGTVCALIPLMEQWMPSSAISVQPVFDEEVLDIRADLYGRMLLIVVVGRILRFILRKPVRKALFQRRTRVSPSEGAMTHRL